MAVSRSFVDHDYQSRNIGTTFVQKEKRFFSWQWAVSLLIMLIKIIKTGTFGYDGFDSEINNRGPYSRKRTDFNPGLNLD